MSTVSKEPVVKVVLGIPIVDSVPGEVFASHLSLATSIGRVAELVIPQVLNVFPHARARELIMDLGRDADYVMWVDSDVEPPAWAFERMLGTIRARDDVVMVTGHCCRRGYPFTNTWSKLADGKLFNVEAGPETVPQEIDACGFPCNLVDMTLVRANLDKPYFRQVYNGEGRENVWEDGYFCHTVRNAGLKILGDPKVRCRHLMGRRFIDDQSVVGLRREELELESDQVTLSNKQPEVPKVGIS
jgi:hypothetical protein